MCYAYHMFYMFHGCHVRCHVKRLTYDVRMVPCSYTHAHSSDEYEWDQEHYYKHDNSCTKCTYGRPPEQKEEELPPHLVTTMATAVMSGSRVVSSRAARSVRSAPVGLGQDCLLEPDKVRALLSEISNLSLHAFSAP